MISFNTNLELTSGRSPESVDILIVDDNADSAETLAQLLFMKKHSVAVSYDGPTAVRSALSLHPSVILLDIMMPQMNGYEVAKELRRHSDLDKTQIVAYSANNSLDDQKRSASAGMNHHLVKTAPFAEINELVTSLLRQSNEAAKDFEKI